MGAVIPIALNSFLVFTVSDTECRLVDRVYLTLFCPSLNHGELTELNTALAWRALLIQGLNSADTLALHPRRGAGCYLFRE